MKPETRDMFVLAGAIALYAVVLWLHEREAFSAWRVAFPSTPRATFARQDHAHRVNEEMDAEPFVFAEDSDGTG